MLIQNFLLFFPFCRHLRQFGLATEDPAVWWKAGVGIAAATLLGFLVMKAFHGTGPHSK